MENKEPENQSNEPAPEPTPPPAAAQPTATSDGLTAEAKNWGMLCHISALAGMLIGGFGNWIGPLVIWLLKKEQFAFVDDQGKESLNFQITCFIAGLVGIITMVIGIGFLIVLAVGILWLIFTIIAAIKASEGETYRYPICLRLIK
jgi:uncharacterized Tic20 family protein